MKNKIYLFYLVTTEYSIRKLTAMSNYRNYRCHMHMHEDPVNHDIVVVMYAWTVNKNLKKIFRECHLFRLLLIIFRGGIKCNIISS